MYKYEVGQVVDCFKHRLEGVQFDISDGGATMLVFFQDPTAEEIDQFKSGKNFEIRFAELYGVFMITIKIGSLNWMDAPYTPHLSQNLTRFQLPNEGQGLGLTLILVDAITGEVKHIRLLGLSEKFTKKLLGSAMEYKVKPFSKAEFDRSVNRIFATYKTSQIVKLSKDYCIIND